MTSHYTKGYPLLFVKCIASYTMAKQYDVIVKLLGVGDSGVGKTCMICRFADDTFFHPNSSTIGECGL